MCAEAAMLAVYQEKLPTITNCFRVFGTDEPSCETICCTDSLFPFALKDVDDVHAIGPSAANTPSD